MALDKVRRHIARLGPAAICDDCLAQAIGLSTRNDARKLARELLGTNGFERSNGKCCMCNAAKATTRKAR
jgi:hypothetical protein